MQNNSLNSPFHSIKQILEFFVKHDNFISVQSYAVPILQCRPPHVCYTWHGKLLVAKGVPNCKKKFKNTCSLQYNYQMGVMSQNRGPHCILLQSASLAQVQGNKRSCTVLNDSIFPKQNRLVALFYFFPKEVYKGESK